MDKQTLAKELKTAEVRFNLFMDEIDQDLKKLEKSMDRSFVLFLVFQCFMVGVLAIGYGAWLLLPAIPLNPITNLFIGIAVAYGFFTSIFQIISNVKDHRRFKHQNKEMDKMREEMKEQRVKRMQEIGQMMGERREGKLTPTKELVN